MNVSEVMTAQVVTATPRSTVREVAQTMAQIESGAVPVTGPLPIARCRWWCCRCARARWRPSAARYRHPPPVARVRPMHLRRPATPSGKPPARRAQAQSEAISYAARRVSLTLRARRTAPTAPAAVAAAMPPA